MQATNKKIEKTFHRWTVEEDKRLIEEIQKNQPAFETIGKPDGISEKVFWAQIPGRIGVLTTPTGCAMRYRTLTSETEWARKRRGDRAPAQETPSADPILALSMELTEIKKTLNALLAVWTGAPSSEAH